ncbi:MAG: hypothetical protein FWF85_05275 [Clostridiales bacterium]|nr:hypothetical protein [Clostridiales bacterium]MDR2712575.1 hypothetical protein [Clostridiales bacterium]
MKKSLVVLLVLAMIFGLSVTALSARIAEADQTIYLKGTGSNFTEVWQNIFCLGEDDDRGSDPNVWHLVYSGKDVGLISEMQLKFKNGEVFEWDPSMGFSVNGGGNNPGWVIVAPSDWELDYVNKGNNNESGCFLTTSESGNINFNISGFHPGKADPKYGSLKVTVNAQEEHDKYISQEIHKRDVWDIYERKMKKIIDRDVWKIFERDTWKIFKRDVWDEYERDIDKYYERDVWDIYQRNVWENWERDTWDIMERDVWDILQREVQPFLRPVFERKMIQAGNGTLVTGRNGNTVPGGTFGNGMTYLEIDVAKARTEGYEFDIADSSPSNKNVGYKYFVRIEGNELVVYFDNRFITAEVSAKVYSTAPTKHDPSGHRTLRTDQELRIALPAPSEAGTKASVTAIKKGNDVEITIPDVGSITVAWEKNAKKTYNLNGYEVEVECNGNGIKSAKITAQPVADPADEGVVYLFFHLASGVKYYSSAEYEFVKWEFKFNKIGEYEKIGRYEGKYKIIDSDATDYEYIDDGASRYRKIDRHIGDYELVKTDKGEWKKTTRYSSYEYAGKGSTKFEKTGWDYKINNVKIKPISCYEFVCEGKGPYDKIYEKNWEKRVFEEDFVAKFNLVIEDEEGNELFNESIMSGEDGELIFYNLDPGTYILILTYDDEGEIISDTDEEANPWVRIAEVVVNEQTPVLFDGILIYGPDVEFKKDPIYKDHKIADVKNDKIVEKEYINNPVDDVYISHPIENVKEDNPLKDVRINNVEKHKEDREGENEYLDKEIGLKYKDNKICPVKLPDNDKGPKYMDDNTLPEKKLGNEKSEDPESIKYGRYIPAR